MSFFETSCIFEPLHGPNCIFGPLNERSRIVLYFRRSRYHKDYCDSHKRKRQIDISFRLNIQKINFVTYPFMIAWNTRIIQSNSYQRTSLFSFRKPSTDMALQRRFNFSRQEKFMNTTIIKIQEKIVQLEKHCSIVFVKHFFSQFYFKLFLLPVSRDLAHFVWLPILADVEFFFLRVFFVPRPIQNFLLDK